jgi:hypothetical protein
MMEIKGCLWNVMRLPARASQANSAPLKEWLASSRLDYVRCPWRVRLLAPVLLGAWCGLVDIFVDILSAPGLRQDGRLGLRTAVSMKSLKKQCVTKTCTTT